MKQGACTASTDTVGPNARRRPSLGDCRPALLAGASGPRAAWSIERSGRRGPMRRWQIPPVPPNGPYRRGVVDFWGYSDAGTKKFGGLTDARLCGKSARHGQDAEVGSTARSQTTQPKPPTSGTKSAHPGPRAMSDFSLKCASKRTRINRRSMSSAPSRTMIAWHQYRRRGEISSARYGPAPLSGEHKSAATCRVVLEEYPARPTCS